jgi:valyl-tRNA synthetase
MAEEIKKAATTYDPDVIEDNYYKIWEERGYFEVDGNKTIQQKDKNFSIMMPPPNVTGRLHIGHALTFTLQDIINVWTDTRLSGSREQTMPVLQHKML